MKFYTTKETAEIQAFRTLLRNNGIKRIGNYFQTTYSKEWHRFGCIANGETFYTGYLNDNYYVDTCEVWEHDDVIQCECCGAYYTDNNMAFVQGGNAVCETCLREEYVYCNECGDYVLCGDYDYDLGMCINCAESMREYVLPYHSGNPNGVVYHGNTDFSFLNGYIGREFEVKGIPWTCAKDLIETYGYDVLHIEEDGSISDEYEKEGFEIIFQPVTFEYYMETQKDIIAEIMEYVESNGGYVDSGTGAHVHFSRTCFGNGTARNENIAKIFNLFSNENYRQLFPIFRDEGDSYWCEPCDEYIDIKNKEAMLNSAEHSRTHEIAVNTQHTHTIEFRCPQTTLDIDRLHDQTLLLVSVVATSHFIDFDESEYLYNWYEKLNGNAKKILNGYGVEIKPYAKVNTIDYKITVKNLLNRLYNIEFATHPTQTLDTKEVYERFLREIGYLPQSMINTIIDAIENI